MVEAQKNESCQISRGHSQFEVRSCRDVLSKKVFLEELIQKSSDEVSPTEVTSAQFWSPR
jgi:hypothetical protein